MPIIHALRRAYLGFSILFLVLVVVLPVMQVTLRNLFSLPVVGAEEWTKYFLICLTFMSAPVAASGAGMITMDELRKRVPTVVKRPLSVLILLLSSAFFAVAAASAVFTSIKNAHVSTALGVPFWVFIVPGTVGFVIVAFEYLLRLMDYLRRGERVFDIDLIESELPTSTSRSSV